MLRWLDYTPGRLAWRSFSVGGNRLDSADSSAESAPAPLPTPPSSLWVTSVGSNFAKVFAVVRRVMGVPASEAKALLSGPAFRVAVDWPSELKPWRDALQAAGATMQIRQPLW
jgi:hypothetical protein